MEQSVCVDPRVRPPRSMRWYLPHDPTRHRWPQHHPNYTRTHRNAQRGAIVCCVCSQGGRGGGGQIQHDLICGLSWCGAMYASICNSRWRGVGAAVREEEKAGVIHASVWYLSEGVSSWAEEEGSEKGDGYRHANLIGCVNAICNPANIFCMTGCAAQPTNNAKRPLVTSRPSTKKTKKGAVKQLWVVAVSSCQIKGEEGTHEKP